LPITAIFLKDFIYVDKSSYISLESVK